MRTKLEKIIHHELGMKDKIENIKTFTKGPKRKNRNQKRDQIGKTYTWRIRIEGLNWKQIKL